jgi:hypothetical protein
MTASTKYPWRCHRQLKAASRSRNNSSNPSAGDNRDPQPLRTHPTPHTGIATSWEAISTCRSGCVRTMTAIIIEKQTAYCIGTYLQSSADRSVAQLAGTTIACLKRLHSLVLDITCWCDPPIFQSKRCLPAFHRSFSAGLWQSLRSKPARNVRLRHSF